MPELREKESWQNFTSESSPHMHETDDGKEGRDL